MPIELLNQLPVAETTKAAENSGMARRRSAEEIQELLEQYRARRVRACQGFRSFASAARTIQGIETVNMIRKGQVRWLAKDDIGGQIAFVAGLFELINIG